MIDFGYSKTVEKLFGKNKSRICTKLGDVRVSGFDPHPVLFFLYFTNSLHFQLRWKALFFLGLHFNEAILWPPGLISSQIHIVQNCVGVKPSTPSS